MESVQKYSGGELISHALVHVCKLYRAQSEALLRAHGLHAGQDLFLMSVWQEEGVTQSQLASQMDVQPATLTNMLHRLSAAHLAERKPDPQDQRVWRVYLTPQGRELQSRLHEVWTEMERRLSIGLSDAEGTMLRQLLVRVSRNLVQAGTISREYQSLKQGDDVESVF